MSKKILILETSVTLQKLFTTTLDGDEYNIQFVNNGKNAINKLFDFGRCIDQFINRNF